MSQRERKKKNGKERGVREGEREIYRKNRDKTQRKIGTISYHRSYSNRNGAEILGSNLIIGVEVSNTKSIAGQFGFYNVSFSL